MSQKYIVYFNIETVRQAYEDMETLPVITVIDDGREKIIMGGMKEIEEVILDIVPYLGSDYSELISIAVEVRDEDEARLLATRRTRKRRVA